MSFAFEAKTELCAIPVEKECCKKALLLGILTFAGVKNGSGIKFSTENPAVKELTEKIVSELYNAEISVTATKRNKSDLYTLEIKNCAAMLEDMGINTMAMHINYSLLKRDCCKRAFIRGAFLGSGSVTDPDKSYHMEISTRHLTLKEEFPRLTMKFGIKLKTTQRSGCHIFYLKGSEKIQDMLTLMGANKTTLKFIDVKITREVRNDINRRQNCEFANMDKTVNAASKQKAAIDRINTTIGLDLLPADLEALAWARLENMEVSLRELGEMMEPPLNKSAVNRRMKKIMEIANELKQRTD
jgi:DNA-binding protein WhiA